MNVLFIHQNFPGQFLHLSATLARDKRNKVVALSIHKLPVPAGVQLRTYSLLRAHVPETHPLLQDYEAKILRGEACVAAALQLKNEGFVPDVIIAHCGWGESLFIKDAFPKSKLIIYCEYYYAAEGQDVGFDPEAGQLSFQQRCQLRLRNATALLSLDAADAAISPTQWQKSTYPLHWQDKISVIHEGIDLAKLKPRPDARLRLGANSHRGEIEFKPGAEVVSYVARNLEPVRGFHQFMRLLPGLLEKRPKAHAIIVGGADVSYGSRPPGGGSWKDLLLQEVGTQLDWRRVHFVGKIPYQAYLDLLNISKVHAYWTTPFVLSWSLLEAAMHGLPVVASNTPPVAEFAAPLDLITPDFFDLPEFSSRLEQQLALAPVKRKNRAVLESIDLTLCIKKQMALINSL